MAAPRLKTFALGVAEDVVVGLLNMSPKLGALVDGIGEDVPPKSGFDFSASDAACVVAWFEEGNWNGLDLSEPADDLDG